MANIDANFVPKRALSRPRTLIDIQLRGKSVYSQIPERVNLSFKAKRKFPAWEMLKVGTVLAVIAVLILGKTTAPTAETLAASAAAEAERAQLEAQLQALEGQMDTYKQQISAYQKQGSSLKGEISKLNAKMSQISLDIKASEIKLKQLDFDISDTQTGIAQTEKDIDAQRQNLAGILRNLYETGQTNVISIFLKSQKFSDFFNDVNNLSSLQDSLRTAIDQITEKKAELEDRQTQLAIQKADQQTLQAYKLEQKQEADQAKSQKSQLLSITKGQESKYQDLLQKTKETAAQIRSRIFQLLGGGEMTFGDAYKLAKMAGDATGVRPSFILAILDRESALGQNVGKCNYKTAMNPNPRKQSDGSYMSDVDIFLELVKDLALQNPESLAVSCANADGPYGGALGPAQFIPSTWKAYSASISAVTGRTPANPWSNADAFVAAGLYLKDAGAVKSERTAAAKYYCGGRWNRYVCTNVYAKKVLDQASAFEDDIAALNQ